MQFESKANILLVDDHPENLLVLEAILEKLGQNLVKAHSAEEALRCVLEQEFAVILLDVQMPKMDGFEAATLIRQRERSRDIPIIFITAFSTNDSFVFRGYSLGAVDYLLKPVDPVILTSKVSVFVELFKKTAKIKQQADQLLKMNIELRQSEERFRSLSACSPVGIFLLDIDGQCTYTNPRCQAICGFTFAESLGKGWIQFLHPDDQERAIADWLNVINHQQKFSTEYRFCTPNGELRWTHVHSSPLFSDSEALIGHVGTIEDITEHKEAEVMRERLIREQAARQQAEAVNRMKDEFLAIVSHELRTPLNSILGWSKILIANQVDEATKTRALETIERNAKSQAKLIEDILDISRVIRGKLRLTIQPLDLAALIDGVLESTRPLADAKNIQIKTSFDPAIPKVSGDLERLRQVIWNLLSNAIKFTPAEGQVGVKLEQVGNGEQEGTREKGLGTRQGDASIPHPLTPSPSSTSPSFAQIAVTDTGVGIHPDFLPHVFEHFRQADSTSTRSYGGLGLGLAIAHHLVNLHGGTITAVSEGEDKGATFTVRLPLTRTPVAAAEAGEVKG